MIMGLKLGPVSVSSSGFLPGLVLRIFVSEDVRVLVRSPNGLTRSWGLVKRGLGWFRLSYVRRCLGTSVEDVSEVLSRFEVAGFGHLV